MLSLRAALFKSVSEIIISNQIFISNFFYFWNRTPLSAVSSILVAQTLREMKNEMSKYTQSFSRRRNTDCAQMLSRRKFINFTSDWKWLKNDSSAKSACNFHVTDSVEWWESWLKSCWIIINAFDAGACEEEAFKIAVRDFDLFMSLFASSQKLSVPEGCFPPNAGNSQHRIQGLCACLFKDVYLIAK